MLKIYGLLFTMVSLLACNGQVQSENKPIEVETPKEHRSRAKLDDQIWAIFQAQNGHFWFGSNGRGLYRYDGKKVTQFTTKDGLVDNQVRGIQEDNKGLLYIETPTGVSRYDGTEFTTLPIIKSKHNQWQLESDDLWFNCNGNAQHIYRCDGQNLYELQLPQKDLQVALGIDTNAMSYSPYTVFGVDKDKKGNLWLGTVLAGAFRFDGTSFLWIGEKELSRLEDGREPGVRSILEDRKGNIWLSNFITQYRIEPNSKAYEKRKVAVVSPEIAKDKVLYFNSGLAAQNGDLWMITYGGGIWKYDGKTISNKELNNGKEDLLLICIYQDKSGTIWLGTNNDGVYRQNGANFEKFEPTVENQE